MVKTARLHAAWTIHLHEAVELAQDHDSREMEKSDSKAGLCASWHDNATAISQLSQVMHNMYMYIKITLNG